MAQSKVQEIADREAAEAEAETTDDDEAADEAEREHDGGDTGADPEPETHDAEAMTQAAWDAMSKKLNAHAERYVKRVQEIMGSEFAGVVPSPLDWIPGFTNPGYTASLDEAVKDEIRALIGDGGAPELREAEGVAMCERCDGYGQLRFPTRSPHVETQPCLTCNGRGYVNLPPPVVEPAAAFTVQPWQPAPATATNGATTPDSWGRPVGHVHYGIPPAQVSA